ncbi:MAG: TatD family hydrolase [bacterium]
MNRELNQLIDTHAHLGDDAFTDDLIDVLTRSKNANISHIITIAETQSLWEPNIELSRSHEFISTAVGLHPHEADAYGSDELRSNLTEILEKKLSEPKVVAIGETGLDYYKNYAAKSNQIELFKLHLKLSQKTQLPLVIHSREAYQDLIELLTLQGRPGNTQQKGVIHCFSGSLEDARTLCDMGYYIGIDGPVTYPKSDNLRNIVKNIPLSSLLLETDCPYLAPQAFRGKRNEPGHLSLIAEEVSRIKQIPLEEVCRIITANAVSLFNLSVK